MVGFSSKNAVTAAFLFFIFSSFLACVHSKAPAEDSDKNAALEDKQSSEELDSDYYFLAAQEDLLKERYISAQKNFEKAYQLDPNEKTGQLLLESTLRFLDTENGLVVAEKMALLYPQNCEIKVVYGELLAKNNQLPEALAVAKKAQELEPKNSRPMALLGFIYEKQEKWDLAILEYEKYLEQDPKSFMAFSQLIKVLLSQSKIDKAFKHSFLRLNNGNDDDESVVLHAGIVALRGNYNESAKLLVKVIERSGKHEDFNDRVLVFITYFGGVDKVLTFYDKVLASPAGKSSTLLTVQKVYLLWEQKKIHQAVDLLSSLLKESKDKDMALIYFLAGLGYEKLRDNDEALRHYKTVDEASRYFLSARLLMINLLRDNERLAEAIALALETSKNRFVTWQLTSVLAQLYFETGDGKKAIATVDDGYKKFPEKLDFLFYRGVYEEKVGEVENCIATMKAVLAVDPDYANALNYLGYLYAQKDKDLEQAKAWVERALVIKPFDGYFVDSLGYIYYKQGDYDKATELFKQALQLAPNEGVILEHVGDVFCAKKRFEEAKEIYEMALTLKVEDEVKKAIEEKIREVETKIPDAEAK